MVNKKAIMGGIGLFAVIVVAIILAPMIARRVNQVIPL